MVVFGGYGLAEPGGATRRLECVVTFRYAGGVRGAARRLQPSQDESWPAARERHAACAASRGRVLVCFGRASPARPFDDAWVLSVVATTTRAADDDVSLEWRRLAVSGESPAARWSHTLTALEGDHFCLAGGRNASGPLSDGAWVLSLARSTWSRVPAPSERPAPAVYAHAACAHSGRQEQIVLFGGVPAAGAWRLESRDDSSVDGDALRWRAPPSDEQPTASRRLALCAISLAAGVLLVGGVHVVAGGGADWRRAGETRPEPEPDPDDCGAATLLDADGTVARDPRDEGKKIFLSKKKTLPERERERERERESESKRRRRRRGHFFSGPRSTLLARVSLRSSPRPRCPRKASSPCTRRASPLVSSSPWIHNYSSPLSGKLYRFPSGTTLCESLFSLKFQVRRFSFFLRVFPAGRARRRARPRRRRAVLRLRDHIRRRLPSARLREERRGARLRPHIKQDMHLPLVSHRRGLSPATTPTSCALLPGSLNGFIILKRMVGGKPFCPFGLSSGGGREHVLDSEFERASPPASASRGRPFNVLESPAHPRGRTLQPDTKAIPRHPVAWNGENSSAD